MASKVAPAGGGGGGGGGGAGRTRKSFRKLRAAPTPPSLQLVENLAYLAELMYSYDEEEDGTGLGLNVREAAERPYFKRVLEEGHVAQDRETVRRDFQKLLAVDGTSIVLGWITSADFYEERQPRQCCRRDLRPSTQCLVLKSPKTHSIVVAFRGTALFERDARDIFTDLQILPSEMWGEEDPDVQVHHGFMQAYQRDIYRRPAKGGSTAAGASATTAEGEASPDGESEASEGGAAGLSVDKPEHSALGVGARIEEILEKALKAPDVVESGVPWTIYLTGHSLGAALALLCTYRLAVLDKGGIPGSAMVKAVTFGMPRVGNVAFREKMKRSKAQVWQVQNGSDIGTNVPSMKGYAHPGYTIRISEKKGKVASQVTGPEVPSACGLCEPCGKGLLWPLKKLFGACFSLCTGGVPQHMIKNYIDLILKLKKDPSAWPTSADMPVQL